MKNITTPMSNDKRDKKKNCYMVASLINLLSPDEGEKIFRKVGSEVWKQKFPINLLLSLSEKNELIIYTYFIYLFILFRIKICTADYSFFYSIFIIKKKTCNFEKKKKHISFRYVSCTAKRSMDAVNAAHP